AWYSDASGPNASKTAGQNQWMASIPDNRLLSALSIPGTHDSATGGRTIIPFVQTQSWRITAQLNAGVRLLDIRFNTSLDFVHGPVVLGGNIRNLLIDCTVFLDANPTECIVVSVKQDTGGNASRFASNFNQAVASWNSTHGNMIYTGSAIPTLG